MADAKTLDDVFDQLKEMVDLSKVALSLQQATLTILTGGEMKFLPVPGAPPIEKLKVDPDKMPDPFSLKKAIYGFGKSAARGGRMGRRAAGRTPPRDLSEKIGSILGSILGGTAGVLGGPAGVVAGAAGGYVAGGAAASAVKRRSSRVSRVTSAKKGAGRAGKSLAESVATVLGTVLGGIVGAGRGVFEAGRRTIERAGHGRMGRFAKIGRGIGKAIGGATARITGRSAKTAGVMSGAAGAVGGAVGGVAALTVGFTKATQQVMAWTDAAFDSARKLAEVSGSMAYVVANRDIQQMFRDMGRGEATSGTAMELMQSEDKLKDTLQPIIILLDNIWNTILKTVIDLIVPPLEIIVDIIKFIYEGIRKISPVALPPWGGAPPAVGGLAADAAKVDASAPAADAAARLMAAARIAAMGGVAPVGGLPPFVLARP